MGKCIIVQTKYGPQRGQMADGAKKLPKSDIEQLEKFIEFVTERARKKLKSSGDNRRMGNKAA